MNGSSGALHCADFVKLKVLWVAPSVAIVFVIHRQIGEISRRQILTWVDRKVTPWGDEIVVVVSAENVKMLLFGVVLLHPGDGEVG